MIINERLKRLLELIDDLNWDYDRMSSSGQETMDKINQIIKERLKMSKVKSFEIYTDDADENKVLVGNSLETALEILENNGYIVEVEYENE
jgi:hypothetical protein